MHTADPRPPRLDPLWLAFGLVPLLFVLGSSAPVKAEVLGFRVEARACRGEVCRPLLGSGRMIGGRYACDGRAARLQDLAAVLPPAALGLPVGRLPWRVTARCVGVEGMARA
ncbi:hypothetical protein [Methylorubrum suomiense]|uniref:Secreted protein n=1 Tax=Methylorubrum suomiense TaxID=144191 RepID=A0ABQ4UT02_9HYPH|nr:MULTISPECIES: hypothetical protein [Methylobacteriaceae]GJE74513.1 hypothetical protein BGCPKDLD_1084 [Methylorubrum suomiense]GJE75867.1 hypothetical protein BGCPKDLD_2454 [Methylorubrum suomiense]